MISAASVYGEDITGFQTGGETGMKRFITTLLVLLMLIVLAACGSRNYQVTTKTGETFHTQGAPEYDMKSETYKFTDEKGEEVILKRADVDVIQEQKE